MADLLPLKLMED